MPEKKLRGLGSLISSTKDSVQVAALGAGGEPEPAGVRLIDVPVDRIVPSPRQPRRTFDKESLDALADSIRRHGLLQPVIVRPAGDKYELIAGERRWRAAQLAGQQTIAAVARPADNAESLTLSIIENLQREDLDPVEEATAYRTLISELNLTQDQVAAHVGRDRSTITNALRLLDLPLSVQAKLESGSLSPGHARVLLAVTDPGLQRTLSEKAGDKGLSVRELERLVYGASGGRGPAPARRHIKPAHIQDLERRLAERLGARVRLKEGRRGGKLIIEFSSDQEFLHILAILGMDTDKV